MFPVVIPVAGLGTRSLPASKAIPKEMLPIFDRPAIQHVVEEMTASQLNEIIFVSSRGKSVIEDHFDINEELESALKKTKKEALLKIVQEVSRMVHVRTVRQKQPLGLGHAVLMAKSSVSSSHFVVALADEMVGGEIPATQQLLHKHKDLAPLNDGGVIMLMKVKDEDVSKYGICEVSDPATLKISKCLEKPQPQDTASRYAITGRYLLPSSIFGLLEDQQTGALGEIQLTDALDALAREGKLYGCVLEGERFDTGDKIGFLKATLYHYLRSPLNDEVKSILKEYSS